MVNKFSLFPKFQAFHFSIIEDISCEVGHQTYGVHWGLHGDRYAEKNKMIRRCGTCIFQNLQVISYILSLTSKCIITYIYFFHFLNTLCVTCIHSVKPHRSPSEVGSSIIPFLWMGQYREGRQLAHSHRAGKLQSQGFKPKQPNFRFHVLNWYTMLSF